MINGKLLCWIRDWYIFVWFWIVQLFNHHWANMYQTQKAGASLSRSRPNLLILTRPGIGDLIVDNISCDKCDVQLIKADHLKCRITDQLKCSAHQLLNCWAPDQMHKTTGHQLKRGPWCSFNQHVILFYSNFVLPPDENLYKIYIYILRYAPPHLLLLK